jgi:DNA/RNA endonuclease YhcR with UshA esterase domain
MKTLVLALGLVLTAAPAFAETIRPDEALGRIGQIVTVEGIVSEVHTAASGRATFIDMGARYQNNVFVDDASKFPNVESLNGKTVDITGSVRLYKGKPEIILNDAAQIKIK